MDDNPKFVNIQNRAPIQNVQLFTELMEHMVSRPLNMLKMAAFAGPAGLGKTVASGYAATQFRAFTIRAGSTWSRMHFCDALLAELGVPKMSATVPKKVDAIIEALATEGRPLIVDEADFLLANRMIEIVRDIADTAFTPVILISMEKFKGNLLPFEQLVSRMKWVEAVPCSFDDGKLLARLYARDIIVEDALLRKLIEAAAGSTRRISNSLMDIREIAAREGWPQATVKLWGARKFETDRVTARRPGAPS